MKRSRAKAIGLGLALFVGPLQAADEGRPVVPAPPNLLPAAVRGNGGEWAAAGSNEAPTLWFPARKPVTAAPDTPTGGAGVVPTGMIPEVAPAGSAAPPPGRRVYPADGPGLMPAIPPAPHVSPPPAATPGRGQPGSPPTVEEGRDWRPLRDPAGPPESPAANPAAPVQQPRPGVGAARTGPPAELPVFAQPGQPLPPPREAPPRIPLAKDNGNGTRPTTTPAPYPAYPGYSELPTAPPEMLVPAGAAVPGKHGSFGSPSIRISRDYPSLHDLFNPWSGGQGHAVSAGAGGAPATDRGYIRAEYLLWWMQSQNIPVLASTTVAPATGVGANGLNGLGFLGDPATRVLLGPGRFGDTLRSGFRVRAGLWFDECGTCGIDGSVFFLGRQSDKAEFAVPPLSVLTRPIFSPNLNAEFGEIVAFPGVSTGTLVIDNSSFLWGADANVRHAICKRCDFRAEWFAGYRFLSLDERLRITEYITAEAGNPVDPPGTRVIVQDQFETRNTFHGGQLGLAAERNWGRLSLDVRGSVALGNTHQDLNITGSQVRLRPGATTPMVFNGGLLAAGPNLGHFSRDRFSVVPEVGVNLGYWLTPNLKAYAGYNFLYWTNVIRPGDQIDRVVDLTFVPNPPVGVTPSGQLRPQPLFRQSDLWVQGVQFGVEWRW
jgi:hypothetical protein